MTAGPAQASLASAMTPVPPLPAKRRELITAILDSRPWNDLAFRGGDIVVSSFGKTGTTWTQAILVQLLHDAPEAPRVGQICRWIDCRWDQEARMAAVARDKGRRILKTHLPSDALRFSDRAKYVHVARDGRDVIWSMHNHLYNSDEDWRVALNAARPEGAAALSRPPADPVAYFRACMADGADFGGFWEHIRGWWALRDHPHVRLLHYQALKEDPEARIRDLAAFLDIALPADLLARTLRHTDFDHMKTHADAMFPGMPMKDGGRTFINRGVNGRWRHALTGDEIAAYEARAVAELGADCAAWLSTGRR